LTTALPPDHAGASLAVLDASPFPRACAGDRGCVAMLGGPIANPIELTPTEGSAASGAAPASAPRVASVAIDKLRRVGGDAAIAPAEDVKKAAGSKPFAAAIVRVCLRPDGTVESTRVVKSSGVPAYDEQLESTIRASWAFEPPQVDNQTTAVCTSATFVAR
jgi:TonB family protein